MLYWVAEAELSQIEVDRGNSQVGIEEDMEEGPGNHHVRTLVMNATFVALLFGMYWGYFVVQLFL